MYKEIICAGFGGQGIMIMGKLLAQAAMTEGRNVTWMPSYGAEVRGGTAHSMIIISDDNISLGVVRVPDDCIVMNRPSLLKFEKLMKKNGIMVINSSLIKDKVERNDLKIIKVPATEIAKQLGNIRIANMVALGAYQKASQILKIKSLIDSLKDVIPPHHHYLIDLNITALEEGAKLSNEYKG
jgi:2-oxoglutarate ferredoxin oxidoreductase subunit gamma